MTNNIGYNGNEATETLDKLFLLSVKEIGQTDVVEMYWEYNCIDGLKAEGETYEWFETKQIDSWYWLRSPRAENNHDFFGYYITDLGSDNAEVENQVFIAFVIG